MNGCPEPPRKKKAIRIISLVLAVFMVFAVQTFVHAETAGVNSNPQGAAEKKSPVIIEQNTSWNATIYRIAEGNCEIEWIAANNEIGVIKHESHCAGPLDMQMTLLAEIVKTFLSHDPNAGSLRTLFWGRIEPDYSPGLHELSFRLALAAYQSPGWDKKRGRARNGDINGFVKELANRAMIYPELKALLANFHKTVTFSSAEKVLVMEAGKLSFFDQLKQHGVRESQKLPFDCMAWFSVSDAREN